MSDQGSKSTSKFSLSLIINSPSLFSGKKIKGQIVIQVKKPLKPSLLLLNFEGREITQWQEFYYEGITQKKTDLLRRPSQFCSHYSEKPIIDVTVSVCQWTDIISEGEHVIPFKYSIPKNLPGSISYNRSHITASISYSLKVFFANRKKNYSYLPIHINQEPYSTENLSVDRPLAKIKNLFGRDKGDCKMKIILSQKYFNSDELISFYVDVDNSESSVALKGLSWRLFHLIKVKNNKGRKFTSCEEVSEGNKKVKIPARGTCTGEKAVKIDVNFGEKADEVLKCPIVKGEFIEVAYYVVVYASIDVWGSRFVEKPQVMAYLPIMVSQDCDTEGIVKSKSGTESVLYQVINLDKQGVLGDSIKVSDN